MHSDHPARAFISNPHCPSFFRGTLTVPNWLWTSSDEVSQKKILISGISWQICWHSTTASRSNNIAKEDAVLWAEALAQSLGALALTEDWVQFPADNGLQTSDLDQRQDWSQAHTRHTCSQNIHTCKIIKYLLEKMLPHPGTMEEGVFLHGSQEYSDPYTHIKHIGTEFTCLFYSFIPCRLWTLDL